MRDAWSGRRIGRTLTGFGGDDVRHVRQPGEEFHVMVFARINEGSTLEEAIAAEGEDGTATMIAQAEAAPGKSKTVEISKELEAGPYAMLCPIVSKESEGKPHFELGQLEEFDIE